MIDVKATTDTPCREISDFALRFGQALGICRQLVPQPCQKIHPRSDLLEKMISEEDPPECKTPGKCWGICDMVAQVTLW